MKKKLIRLTESDLHRIVKESVKKIMINELGDTRNGQEMLGRVAGRAFANGNDDFGNKVGKYADDAAELYDDSIDSHPYEEHFDDGMKNQYAYEQMMQDKDFLKKMARVYAVKDYGYDDMLSQFEFEFSV